MSAPRDRPAGKILPRWRLRSAPQKTQSSLKSRLIVALLLVAWLPALIALPLHYRLIDENAGEHARRQLAQLSTVQQRRIDRELDRLIDGLALVAAAPNCG